MRVRKLYAPFSALRFAIDAIDMSCAELAIKLQIAPSTLSLKMNGKQPFTQIEQYQILDIIGASDERLHEYFPRGGKTA